MLLSPFIFFFPIERLQQRVFSSHRPNYQNTRELALFPSRTDRMSHLKQTHDFFLWADTRWCCWSFVRCRLIFVRQPPQLSENSSKNAVCVHVCECAARMPNPVWDDSHWKRSRRRRSIKSEHEWPVWITCTLSGWEKETRHLARCFYFPILPIRRLFVLKVLKSCVCTQFTCRFSDFREKQVVTLTKWFRFAVQNAFMASSDISAYIVHLEPSFPTQKHFMCAANNVTAVQ